jgi:hypothetical protein
MRSGDIQAERGVHVDHTPWNRWIVNDATSIGLLFETVSPLTPRCRHFGMRQRCCGFQEMNAALAKAGSDRRVRMDRSKAFIYIAAWNNRSLKRRICSHGGQGVHRAAAALDWRDWTRMKSLGL